MQIPGAHERYTTRRYFGSLHGLRAVSVLAVIWHHSSAGPGILARGYYGVELFFAISGFLITTLLLRERDAGDGIDLKAFWARRALRIMPVYYLVLAMYVLLWWVTFRGTPLGDRFLGDLPFLATFTSNWSFDVVPGQGLLFYHSWSLATEEQFYLVWPPLLALALRRGLGCAALVITSILAIDFCFSVFPVLGESLLRTVVTSASAAICGGALLAISLHARRTFRLLAPLMGHRWSSVVTATVLLALLGVDAPSLLIDVACVVLVGTCCVREDHAMSRPLSWRPLIYVGSISYCMYLVHYLVLPFAMPLSSGPFDRFLLTVLLSMGVGAVSYRFLEAPVLAFKDRVASADRSRTSDAVERARLAQFRSMRDRA